MKPIFISICFTLFTSLSLMGCKAPPFSPDSPLSSVPVQSKLVLQRSLTIPPNKLSLWFQDGKQMKQHQLDHYYPHCKFETYEMRDTEKTIEPDTFIIHKVVRWDDYAFQTVRLASARIHLGTGPGDADPNGLGPWNAATEMFLKSVKQPDVYRLVCSQWEDPHELNHVTINEIRATLKNIFTLELPEGLKSDGK